MLKKQLRFHGHGSLKYLYKNAEVRRGRYATIRMIENPRRKHSRFTVVISKKVHKSAVGRNRIRRRVYEILRQQVDDFVRPTDIAVIVTNGEALMAPFDQLSQDITTALHKTK